MRYTYDIKKRIAALTAALLMTAGTGCANSTSVTDTAAEGGSAQAQKLGDTPVSKGRYVEENIGRKEIYTANEFGNSAEPCFCGCAEGTEKTRFVRWRLLGEGFEAEDLSAEAGADNVLEAVVSPNGDMFYSEYDDETYALSNFLLTKDGEKKKLELKDGEMLLSYEFSADGRLFALNDKFELLEIDTSKMQANRLCVVADGLSKLDITGDIIWASGTGGINGYDLSKGSMVQTDTALESLWKDHVSEHGSESADDYDIFAGTENDIYLVCQDGIFRYALGGSMTEQIVDGLYTDLGSTVTPVRFGTLDKDGSFIISFSDSTIKRYRYDPEAVNEFISELKIYALKNNKTLSQTIRAFAKKHPEVKLDLEIGMKNGMTYEDAAKNLTAEMMSGKAPDLMLLDGLDTEAFEEKGMLLDLSALADKWKPDEDIYSNIVEWNSEGGLYSVACRFGLPVLVSRSDKIDGIESYKDIADLVEERFKSGETAESSEEFFPEDFAGEAVERVIGLYANRMIKDGKPDEAVIRELFESAKRINDLPEHGIVCEENGYTADSAVATAHEAGTGLLGYSAEIILNMESLYDMTSIHDDKQESDIRFGIKDAPSAFVPVCELGICASSEQKDIAAEFIGTALSGDVQSADTGDGLPVIRKGFENQFTKDKDLSVMVMMYDFDGAERYFSVNVPDDEEQAELYRYIESADTAVRLDDRTKSDLTDAGVRYLNGEITLDEAVSRIKDKLELRMKE